MLVVQSGADSPIFLLVHV